jgi:peptidoglycan/xylan/chitin deacetylase (PgdA/CDA1 family)
MLPIKHFLFHRVSPERDILWDPMDPALFERCLRYITHNFEVINLEEAINIPLNQNIQYATILFDDGFKDNIQYAAPLLEKYGINASFYVVTDCIEKNVPTWTSVLENLFQKTLRSRLVIDFDFISPELQVSNLFTPKERIEYVKKLKPFLKKVTHEQRNLVLDRVQESYSDVPESKIMMNWDDLRELKKAGHYIGSHTVTHAMLGTMTDANEILFELSHSAKMIKNNLGHFPLTISYPVGSYNTTTISLAKSVGYKIGLAVQPLPKVIDANFEIPRVELYNEPWLKTRLRINGLLERVKNLLNYQ